MDLDQETAKELVKSVIDGFEEESIVNAESVTLFLCRECLPYLTKMNIPANIVQAVNGLAEKNEDLTAAGSLTDLVIAQDGRLQRVIVAGFGKGDGIVQCFLSRFDHLGCFIGNGLDQHRFCIVTDKPLVAHNHIDRYRVPLTNHTLEATNTVNDFVVH